ncbi:hypothetical protein F5Y18DRAFT_231014 [Xylariaceae sp. FL1019]|nr:hypothetical protein F5Y18DRAFT_231014 [Xylariaceae sp. FL1019]
MGVTSGIGHLFESIGEVFQGIFLAIFHAFQFVFNTVLQFFQFILNTIIGLFQGFVNFVEGTLGFAIHNFFILGTLAAVVLGYMVYTQRKGIAPASHTIKKNT